jgi:hypothetical protein
LAAGVNGERRTLNGVFPALALVLLARFLERAGKTADSPKNGVFVAMSRIAGVACLSVVVLALMGPAPPALAAAQDGNWSVLIITEKGDCDRAYRYPLAVANGQVRYAGDSGANVSGTVSASGAVKVSIRLGDKGANGSGRLSGGSGSGTWRGAGGGASCAGRWEAERR